VSGCLLCLDEMSVVFQCQQCDDVEREREKGLIVAVGLNNWIDHYIVTLVVSCLLMDCCFQLF